MTRRKIAKLIFGPIAFPSAFSAAQRAYDWFRRGENRFLVNGLHGATGSLFFESFDRGLKALDEEEYRGAFYIDAAAHTKRRFSSPLRSRPSKGKDKTDDL